MQLLHRVLQVDSDCSFTLDCLSPLFGDLRFQQLDDYAGTRIYLLEHILLAAVLDCLPEGWKVVSEGLGRAQSATVPRHAFYLITTASTVVCCYGDDSGAKGAKKKRRELVALAYLPSQIYTCDTPKIILEPNSFQIKQHFVPESRRILSLFTESVCRLPHVAQHLLYETTCSLVSHCTILLEHVL